MPSMCLDRAVAASLLPLLVLLTACDLIARPRQPLVLGDRGMVFGTSGNAQQAPVPAIQVVPEGSVTVLDADVFGGSIAFERVDQQRFGVAAPGILADTGAVRVVQGLIQGGSIVVQAPVDDFDAPAPAIDASFSRV